MRCDVTRDASAQNAPMLRWLLQREARTITCQLDARGGGTYEICLLPHWDPEAAVIERYDAPTPAMRTNVANSPIAILFMLSSRPEHGSDHVS